jgi:hypothetical protein
MRGRTGDMKELHKSLEPTPAGHLSAGFAEDISALAWLSFW